MRVAVPRSGRHRHPGLDGLRAQVEALADRLVGASFGHHLQHVPLAFGQVVERAVDASAPDQLYGFRSLHAFKMKFNPRFEPMYLAYRDEGDLPRIGMALTRAYLPDTNLRTLVRLATTHD